MAANQGVSDVNLAKWMGRRDLKQNLAYKHGSLAERVKSARELILNGEAHGAVARIMSTMPVADREAFVKSVVETAHATDYGICLHNFAASPCPNHMQCLRKCGDYLRVKGDMAQRQALLSLRELESINLQRSQLALTEGYYGADKWVASTTELIEGIDEALAVDDDASVKDGTQLKVFSEKTKLTKLLK